MHIAIATSHLPLPPSDQALAVALGSFRIPVHPEIWSAPGVSWQTFDAVLVRSCWDYHLREAEFLQWLSRLEGLKVRVLNSPALLRWNRNKRYLRELEQQGNAIPATVWLGEGEQVDVAQVCTAKGWNQAVIKPLVSASAYRTERRSSGVVSGEMMLQEYLPAIEEEGEWSLMWFNHRFSHAVRKRPRQGDFRVQQELGGTAETAIPDTELLEFSARVLTRLPERAVWARVDLLRSGGLVVLMELEVIEPELFLSAAAGTDMLAARAVLSALAS